MVKVYIKRHSKVLGRRWWQPATFDVTFEEVELIGERVSRNLGYGGGTSTSYLVKFPDGELIEVDEWEVFWTKRISEEKFYSREVKKKDD